MEHDLQHYHFVTGKLAEQSVRSVVARVAEEMGFAYSIQVLPITVAALITAKWLMRHIEVPMQTTKVIVPGYLEHETAWLREQLKVDVQAGPRNIRDLSRFWGRERLGDDYGKYDIQIIGEINHANRMSLPYLLKVALDLAAEGADVIDLGCTPGESWNDVGNVVQELSNAGLALSIDSFDPWEVEQACNAGAQLVLSVNSSNREAAADWGKEVVVIPDTPQDSASFHSTIEFLAAKQVPFRLDPILEPLGCGFTGSLSRYIDCRRSYPDAQMMMGIGNITELTDVDSAGVNVLLLAICQELKIQSVLTTQVINWARTSVKECDLARRLVHYAYEQGVPPKHLEPDLVLLRDPSLSAPDLSELAALAEAIRDGNLRIFVAEEQLHLISTGFHASGSDPYALMQQLLDSHLGPKISVGHAFYLGYELSKAVTALTLGKQYDQDQPLNWGFLTQAEKFRRLERKASPRNKDQVD